VAVRSQPAGLILEYLLTDRIGGKGYRDPLVAAGMLGIAGTSDLDETRRRRT
jgi:hypothetical protein